MGTRPFVLSLSRAVYSGVLFGSVVGAWDVLLGELDWSWTRAAARGTYFAIAMLAMDLLVRKLSSSVRLREQARLAMSRGRVPSGIDLAAWCAVVERERPSPASIAGRDVLPPALAVVSLGLVAARGGGDAAALWVLAGCWAIVGVVGLLWRLDQRNRADVLLGTLACAARDRPFGAPQDVPLQGPSRAAGPQNP